MSSSESFQKANSFFVDEQFEEALVHYNQAIESDPSNPEYFLKRAACHLKLNNFTDALTDSNTTLKLQPQNSMAYFRKGVACFELEEYETAQEAFESGQQLEPTNSNFKTWLRKCAAELKDEQIQETKGPELETRTTSSTAPATTLTPTPSSTTSEPSPAPSKPSAPSIRHEWYQTGNFVIVSVFCKGLKKDQVDVKIEPTEFEVCIRHPSLASEYILDMELFDRIDPEKSKWTILSTKLEIKLAKIDMIKWPSLEKADTGLPVARWDEPSANTSAPNKPPPSSNKKNWDKIAKDESDDKLEGDEALNKVFQDIYSGGSEEQRRAMMKSFYESGGTVLSTNWSEVGKETVKGSPPKGMEMRKWSDLTK